MFFVQGNKGEPLYKALIWFELTTDRLRVRRATHCAMPPQLVLVIVYLSSGITKEAIY